MTSVAQLYETARLSGTRQFGQLFKDKLLQNPNYGVIQDAILHDNPNYMVDALNYLGVNKSRDSWIIGNYKDSEMKFASALNDMLRRDRGAATKMIEWLMNRLSPVQLLDLLFNRMTDTAPVILANPHITRAFIRAISLFYGPEQAIARMNHPVIIDDRPFVVSDMAAKLIGQLRDDPTLVDDTLVLITSLAQLGILSYEDATAFIAVFNDMNIDTQALSRHLASLYRVEVPRLGSEYIGRLTRYARNILEANTIREVLAPPFTDEEEYY